MANERAPIIENPELLDKIIGNIQQGLADNLPWLDKAYGRAERLVKMTTSGKRIYTPNVYAGGNEYTELTPDSKTGNFCFFTVDDPQDVTWERGFYAGIKCPFSIIFWFDYRRIFGSADNRNKEQLKKQIIEALNFEGMKPEDIDADAPLFREGLGLDSIDALELIVLMERKYGIKLKDPKQGKEIFRSVRTMAEYIQENRTK